MYPYVLKVNQLVKDYGPYEKECREACRPAAGLFGGKLSSDSWSGWR